MNYLLHLLVYFNIYLVLAVSLNLVVGYTGRLSLAHAAFFAIGGYAYGILSVAYSWPLPAIFLIGVAVAAGASLALGIAAWRLRGDFYVLATLAAQVVVYSAIYNWATPGQALGSWNNLTNGPFGITGIPPVSFFGDPLDRPAVYAAFSGIIAGACAWLVWRITGSPFGRSLIALRDDESAAIGLGKDVDMLALQALTISAVLAAVAGIIYAGYVRYVDPEMASIDESILMLSMVLIGGIGNLRGPLVGAAVLILLPEALRYLSVPEAQASTIRLAIFGILLVAIVHWRPQGLGGKLRYD